MQSVLLSLASAVLLILVFPRFELVWLAPAALAPLLYAIADEPSWKRRFLLGEIAGIVYWFGICYWIQFVLEVHGGMGTFGSWSVFALFCLGKALHMAAFAALAGPLLATWYAIPAVAALWVGLERTHENLGFAWLPLGNAAVDMGVPMRLAPWIGVYGVSFVLAMMSVALTLAALRQPRRRLLWLLALPALYLLPELPAPARGSESAVLVQPNLPQDQHWTEESTRRMHDRLLRISLEAALAAGEQPAKLIVWPEVPAPIYYENDARFREQAQKLAHRAGAHFLFGTVAYTREGSPLNSAQLLTPQGEPAGRYDKMYLVPFGEFVPSLFGFVNRITKEAGDFAPGRDLIVFRAGDRRLGAFICYESVFPHLVRRFAAAGADVFLNLSNDGYFGQSAARRQHLLIVRMRAAENRRWIVRATNDGITASIDPAGRIAEFWDPHIEQAGRMSYSRIRETTSYTRYGDWFAWLCLGGGVGFSPLTGFSRSRRFYFTADK